MYECPRGRGPCMGPASLTQAEVCAVNWMMTGPLLAGAAGGGDRLCSLSDSLFPRSRASAGGDGTSRAVLQMGRPKRGFQPPWQRCDFKKRP